MKFWNKTARKYDAWIQRAFYDQYVAIKQKLNRHIWPNDQILDIGTGTGEIAFEIAKNASISRCIGADISPDMIDIANKKRAELRQKNVTFQVEDAYNLSFQDAEFDKVICCNALQTMKMPIKAIQECNRVLKPGGEFLSFTYCFGDSGLWERLKLIKWVVLYGMPKYWENFTRVALTGLFEKVGMTVLESEDVWQKPVILFLRCQKK